MNHHPIYHKTTQEVQDEWNIIEKSKLNPQEFALLYDAYFKPILQFVYQRLETKEQAVDIVQNTFVKALQNIGRFQFKGVPFSAWLYRIALNEVNDFYRKTGKNRMVNLDDNTANNLASDNESNQEEEVVTFRKKTLQNAIRQLSNEEFVFLEMRFFDQLAFAEIAAIMGITENNAKVKTYRILEKVRKLMTIK
jgi:RNA polymerase sigma-70 factor, ECF subfamily